MSEKEMQAAATALLRKAGYTWAGREKRKVDTDQSDFERRVVKCGFRGSSRKGR